MPSPYDSIERECLPTPLLVFECVKRDGSTERWSTHRISLEGNAYEARVLRHNAFEMQSSLDDGLETSGRLELVLGDADGCISQSETAYGYKGAKLTARFVFFDLAAGVPVSDPQTIFIGLGDTPRWTDEAEVNIAFLNRLNIQATQLPRTRIQATCPWMFPTTPEQRAIAVGTTPDDQKSLFAACGYSPDQPNGRGNLHGGGCYKECRYTKEDCQARGMYSIDELGRETARFGGFQYLPPSTLVRSHGDKNWRPSEVLDNRALKNDAVPLLYGTTWHQAPVIFGRNDGNLTHLEVLLGSGPIEGVLKVVVNDVEIPAALDGRDMTASGWYRLISNGDRTGKFNPDFAPDGVTGEGDPHGGNAVLSVVVPQSVSGATSVPKVLVLVNGLKLDRFAGDGQLLDTIFTRNPAWVILDALRRCGWKISELDLPSFIDTAQHCEQFLQTTDANGQTCDVLRFEINLAISRRRSAADILRGLRAAAALHLCYTTDGKIALRPERTIAEDQPVKPAGSNCVEPAGSGWPAYEFGDGSNGPSGILRKPDGRPSLRLFSRTMAETPNRLTVEFQDALNEYQHGAVSMVDMEALDRCGQEQSGAYPGLGIANANQAARLLRFQLRKKNEGNLFVQFETSVKGLGLRPGDIIALTWLRQGLQRSLWRIQSIRPSENYARVGITAQFHDDTWYSGLAGGEETASTGRRQSTNGDSAPRPLCGTVETPGGEPEFEVTERPIDGALLRELTVSFRPPRPVVSGGPGIPIVDLHPFIYPGGGTLPGGTSYYYCVSALDSEGRESPLSYAIEARIPDGASEAAVALRRLSFPASATGCRLYRGPYPQKLFLVGEFAGTPTEIVDTGLASQAVPPPNANYHHANFYWRVEKLPETTADTFSSHTIGSSLLTMNPDEFRGCTVRITSGTGRGQERTILSHSESVITLAEPWRVLPGPGSQFTITEPNWRPAGRTSSDQISILVSAQSAQTVQILGLAANAKNRECSPEISPLTRCRLSDSGGGEGDVSVPGMPVFAVRASGGGVLEFGPVAFESLENTRGVFAGTLSIDYWDELNSPSPLRLSSTISDTAEVLAISPAHEMQPHTLLQIGDELVEIVEAIQPGTEYQVERGFWGSPRRTWPSDTTVYPLSRKMTVIPFVPDFFGSPASESFRHSIHMSDTRVSAVTFSVRNQHGNSPTRAAVLTGISDHGLRTLSGGQYSLQIPGQLAIQANAVPPLVIEARKSVRDIFATLGQAPVGAPARFRLYVNELPYCELTVPAGSSTSNTVSGFGLPPLPAGAKVSLDVLEVGLGAGTFPGADLTVTLRT